MKRRFGLCLLVAIVAGLLARSTVGAAAPLIWLAGSAPVKQSKTADERGSDFVQLFDPAAPWMAASKTIRVFKTPEPYLNVAPDAVLRNMFDDLRRRHIALAAATLMLDGQSGQCGVGVEGYAHPRQLLAMARRIKALGGQLSYAAMDEPLWFGHFDRSPNACRASVADVARVVASNVRAIREVFPDIQVGDMEPVAGSPENSVSLDDLLAFADAYRRATGAPLAFFHADVHWSADAPRQLASWRHALHAAGLRFGVMYPGGDAAQSDVEWADHAEADFTAVEQPPGEVPDDAIIQSWTPHPSHFLPETAPGTLTNLVLRYERVITSLEATWKDGAIVGRLARASGAPLAGAPVDLWSIDAGTAGVASKRDLQGVAPQGATAALVALRVNAETTAKGAGAFTLGVARFGQPGAPEISRDGLGGADRHGQVVTTATRIARNTPPFPVIGGQPFDFDVPVAASGGLEAAGYVAVIFLGADGKGLGRFQIPLSPTRSLFAQARTDADGRFRVAVKPASSKSLRISVAYPGEARFRGATTDVK